MVQQRQRTAEDVAQMETDIAWFREENDRLSRELAVATAEKTRLQVENLMLQGSSAENARKCNRVEGILDNICNGLVTSLREIREERQISREVRRQTQEIVLTREGGDARPKFLEKAEPEEELARTEQLRGAAEHIAPPVLANRPGRIDHTLADRDPRLPRPEGLMRETVPTNEDNLRDISGSMKTRR